MKFTFHHLVLICFLPCLIYGLATTQLFIVGYVTLWYLILHALNHHQKEIGMNPTIFTKGVKDFIKGK